MTSLFCTRARDSRPVSAKRTAGQCDTAFPSCWRQIPKSATPSRAETAKIGLYAQQRRCNPTIMFVECGSVATCHDARGQKWLKLPVEKTLSPPVRQTKLRRRITLDDDADLRHRDAARSRHGQEGNRLASGARRRGSRSRRRRTAPSRTNAARHRRRDAPRQRAGRRRARSRPRRPRPAASLARSPTKPSEMSIAAEAWARTAGASASRGRGTR